MSSALTLASRLRRLPDDEILRIIESRGLSATGIADFFDLAEALLDTASVQRALGKLDRPTLGLLASAAEAEGRRLPLPEASRLLGAAGASPESVSERVELAAHTLLAELGDDALTVYETVAERLRAWSREGLPDRESLLTPPPPVLAPVSAEPAEVSDRRAAERAFSTVVSLSEVLAGIEDEPARELSKGGLSLPETRRLAEGAGVDLADVAPLLALAHTADLVVLDDGEWFTTPGANSWGERAIEDRWGALAGSWRDSLPDEVRTVLAGLVHADWGDRLLEHVRWLYPAAGEWMAERVRTYRQHARLLGIANDHSVSRYGRLLLTEGRRRAETDLGSDLPPAVEKVYVQNDLTIIAPGPLAPPLDARLRRFTDVENRGLATGYRLSPTALVRALIHGEDARSLLNFLESLSMTGVPQPVEYLIEETAARFGSVRVQALEDASEAGHPGARSCVRVLEPAGLAEIVVDQRLSPLGLTATGAQRAVSRVDVETLYRALVDARYPVVLEDADGSPLPPPRPSRRNAVPRRSRRPAEDLVGRLRESERDLPEEDAAAWLTRQLDLAVRTRTPLLVGVRMPGGTVSEFLLEPTSVAGGRLRAKDRRSDLERTLPLSSIDSVRPADAH